ncbi:hypothetical protein DIS24_g13 [Lasiodiplodia hormozganensis]|uniref:Uncharacterized protein n=1 Tax=Lasiodiplodia hormozganensis TaxID=869390 RepID=A0AA39Z746_9PEZI|nr:hypothetical protein DIS24_g13 [Lasiodiplodia hormozganensis]
MVAPVSPNPARNPALGPGEGKYDKNFLLAFRDIFTKPPEELDKNLRRAGVKRPLTPPPRSNLPSISVTPAGSEHKRMVLSVDMKLNRKENIGFLQRRTEERLNTKEAELAAHQKDLDHQKAELEQQKRNFNEERAQLYEDFINSQSRLDDRFQNLRVETDKFERSRLEHTAQILSEKAQLENAKKASRTQASGIQLQSGQMKDNMIATAKRALAFFQIKDNISDELGQRALAALEADIIALEEEELDCYSFTSPENVRNSQSEPHPLSTSNLVVPRQSTNGLVLITGIPHGLKQDEVIRAVNSISGNTIKVYAVLPGPSTMTALASFVHHPVKLFEGNFYVAKDGSVQSIGSVRLHFVSDD